MIVRNWLGGILALSLGLNIYLLLERANDLFVQTTEEPHQQLLSAKAGTIAGTVPDSLTSNSSEPITGTSAEHFLDEGKPGAQLRATWLQQNREWLQDGQYQRVTLFLQNYLKQYPQDLDFLILEGDLVAKTSLLSDAILHYYTLLNLPLNKTQRQQVTRTIDSLIANTITQLKKAYSWDILAVFVEPLLQIAPTNREFILALGQAYAEQQQATLMENTLAALDYSDPDAMAIRAIIEYEDITAVIPQGAQDNEDLIATAVNLVQHGDQYVVGVQLNGNNLNLLLDTGATTTAISRQVFSQFSNRYTIKFIGQFTVNTAGGKILAPMYQFASLQINHATVENITVLVLPIEDMKHADGLLGMNFLREFEFRLDQKNAKLYLH
ncbi:MAG: clan AA aspartic protease (TIGR02281 family) [Paraglaciecola sp.]|jgi:clan AA aspartic protease (TIGR02281 family)